MCRFCTKMCRFCTTGPIFSQYKIQKTAKIIKYTKMTRRGALIVFEGCDRSGKTTQSSLLVKHFESKNISVKHMKFPDRTTIIGQMIDSYLKKSQELSDESIHLLFSANRWEFRTQMEKLLNSGTTLIVDRYSFSGIAYTTVKGKNFEWCKFPERGLVKPDLVFYLKTAVGNLENREDFGTEIYEKSEIQKKVAKIFEQFCEKEPEYWKLIDGGRSIEAIKEDIVKEAESVLENVKHVPVGVLWPID